MPLIVWIVRNTLASSAARAGVLLQRDEVAVELVEVLMTLDQELADDLVQAIHGIHARLRLFAS